MSTATQVQVDNPRPLASIIADLSKQIAPEDLESRKQGSSTLVYISWHRALKYLDRYAPGWSYEVRDIYHLAGRVALVVRVSIPCAEGVVYREATGQEDEENVSYGDPTSNAESMALRRAAAKFGLGLYLYDKSKKPELEGARDPHPKTLGDIVTPKQLWMIRNLGRELGIDVEKAAQGRFKLALESISKRSASMWIEELKNDVAEADEPEPVRNVKLEGAQPTSPAEELMALNRKLGFTPAQLLKWLTQKFNVDSGLTLHSALGSLGEGEISQAIDIFRQKVENR